MIRMLKMAVLGTVLLAGTALADARAELVAFTNGLKGLDGQFSQTVYNANGAVKERSSGRVALSTPDLFRWEYSKPYEQLIVADGRKVWIYEPDLQQATVRDQGSEAQSSPLAALLKPKELDAKFDVSQAPAAQGLEWMTLTPKRDDATSGFEVAELGFANGQLKRMKVTDAVGQRTEVEFSGWKRNPAFAAGTFSYKPATGVDVVGAAQ
ncbi:outer membrane lipoprotein chaperone LolA [Pseudoxanthomonas winnipegensis]|jgi:outer membrane lipoprotein carrier protein|uniref:Outer-membrane lipoprotein carrier protein n=1 Tax=Pseudoxanthomonas winnipegensis TaxID=2480810 RepID=A0A4Q8L5S3_9GAMM|nr:outer membrane lipoprotein chaperone LolA [Pseudoxanthomonas winnipegensis]TAA21814.1 outer membrane lipoprotein chaperone LolA [Pseudoxanthomonas winnipegensis]